MMGIDNAIHFFRSSGMSGLGKGVRVKRRFKNDGQSINRDTFLGQFRLKRLSTS